MGDSAPTSDGSSDGSSTSESFDQSSDWHQPNQKPIVTSDSTYSGSTDIQTLSPDTGGAIKECERIQVESFFSGLGTEVRKKNKLKSALNCLRLITY